MCDITREVLGRKPKYIYKLVYIDLDSSYNTIYARAIIKENSDLTSSPDDNWYDKGHPLYKYKLTSGFATLQGARILYDYRSQYRCRRDVILKIKVDPEAIVYMGTANGVISPHRLDKFKTYGVSKWSTITEIKV